MRFSILNQAVTALAFSASAYAAAVPTTLNPAQIVTALQGLTSKANALGLPVGAITADNALLALTGGGPIPAVITQIQDIALNAQGLAILLQQSPNIPSGNPAASVISAFNSFAAAQQLVLSTLNSRLSLLGNAPTVAAPVTAALSNLQVALTNLAEQLTARLGTQATPTAAPTDALTGILTQLLSTVTGLLNGLNLSSLLGGLPTLPGGVGSTGGATGGLPGLPALPFATLPIGGLSTFFSGLNLGSLPILGTILGGASSGGSPLGGLGGLLTPITSIFGGLGGGILARVASN